MRNRRRNRWLVWLCVVIVVAGAVVVGINVLSKNPLMLETLLEALPSVMEPVTDPATDLAIDPVIEKVSLPDGLLPQYFALAGNRKYEEMYEMLTDQDKATISRDDFVAKNRSVYDGIEARNITVAIDEVTVVNINGRTVVKYSVRMDTLAGEISYSNQATFDEVKSELSDEDESEDKDKEYRMQWTTRTIFPDLGPSDRVRVQTLEAIRGNIYDRNHELLAGPGMASAVGFVPGKMQKPSGAEPSEYDAKDIAKVAELLEITPESILSKLEASYVRDDTFVALRTVSKDDTALEDALLTVKGIMITDTPVRYYPLGKKASHLVGYIQNISSEELGVLQSQGYHTNSVIGKIGLEKIYENELRGRDGSEIAITDSSGNLIQSLAKKDKVDGKDLVLTIDAQTQSQLYDLFASDKSCSVATNPKTGEVLALVSTPSYDANDFVLGMSESKWTALNEDENLPMLNRFKAALCPGSTMKPLTAAIGLNTGIITPDEDFGHSGKSWQKDGSWGGYYISTLTEYNDPANIENALVYSDNIFFAKAAMKIGGETFASELKRIGFEAEIPFEYALNSSTVSSTRSFSSEIQLADSGFGQGQILVNPIHLALAYASFINEGDIFKPRLISGGSTQVWIENAFSPETATTMKNNLIQVVERGTAKEARIPGTALAAKTGTAEIKLSHDDVTGTELGWFVMFNADENTSEPLLVATMVEDVKKRGGSHYAIPMVKTLFE